MPGTPLSGRDRHWQQRLGATAGLLVAKFLLPTSTSVLYRHFVLPAGSELYTRSVVSMHPMRRVSEVRGDKENRAASNI